MKFSCLVSRSNEIFMSLPLSVLSQSGPPKSVGSGGGGGRLLQGGEGGRIPHDQYIGVAIYIGVNI